MATRQFRAPVAVYIAGPIGVALFKSLERASDFLFDHWPGNDSLAWTDAMKYRADDDAVDDASAAFLCALKEAGAG